MNLAAAAPEWLAWLLVVLLLAAAAEDAVRMRISNWTCSAVLGLAVVAIAVAGFSWSLWQNAVVFAAVLAGGTFLFSRGKLGGGDAKLFAALALWFDLRGAFGLTLTVFLAGGLLALLIIVMRLLAPAGASKRVAVLAPGSGIPYGIAIAAGGILMLALQRG